MLVCDQCGRQSSAFELLVCQRIISGKYPILHGHVQAGRRLAGARNPDENDVRQAVIAGYDTIIGRQGEIGRLDAQSVAADVRHPVRPALGPGGRDLQFFLQRTQKCFEEIQIQGIAGAQYGAQFILHQGAENDGSDFLGCSRGIDAPCGFMRLLDRRNKRQRNLFEGDTFELRE